MAEEQILAYVQHALELIEDGQKVVLGELCAEHPDLIPAVAAALDMDAELPKALSQDPLVGSTLEGRYRLEDWIGAGAMGAVYAGKDSSLGREIAVKVLQHGVLASEQRQQRFVREAKVLASLDHPNIVRIFDHGVADERFHFIVMERLMGASLSAVLEEQIHGVAEGEQPIWAAPNDPVQRRDWLSQVAAWGVQLASALGSAHDEGVFHRDLKPSNVMVDSAGNAILLDFGIATREGEGSLTVGGTTLGTPWYMSPEQALDPTQVSPQVDLYGLCATFYHLVTHQPPYDGDYQQVLIKLQKDDPVPPGKLRPELPRDLCAIIEKGMERDPARRYRNAGELEADLRAFLAHLPVSARPLTALGRRWRRIKARPAGYIAAVVVLVALVGTVWATSAYQAREIERERREAAEYRRLFASWAPAAAHEGSVGTRRFHSESERRADLDLGARILKLRPDDIYSRMIRCAVALDAGQVEVSLADMQYLREQLGKDAAYVMALTERYEALPADAQGAGALSLNGLPEPATDPGRFVAGFHLARIKDYDGAFEVLSAASSYLPARLMNLSPLATICLRNRGEDRIRELTELRAEARSIEDELGFVAARTTYFRGFGARWSGDLVSAREIFGVCLGLNENYNVLFSLAEAERKTLEVESARDHYLRAIELRPWNANAQFGYAQLLAGAGELDLAESIAEKLPTNSRLTKPWQKDYLLGRITTLRLVDVLINGGDGALVQAKALGQFRRSLSLVGDDDRGRRTVASSISAVSTAPGLGNESVSESLKVFRGSVLSPLHVRWLAHLLSREDMTAADQAAISKSLQKVGEQLQQIYKTKSDVNPIEASLKKNK